VSGKAPPLRGQRFDPRPSIVRRSARAASRKGVALAFRLAAGGTVQFAVTQLTPICRTIGSFAISARAGANRVPLRPRVGGRRLAAGTYEVVARSGSRALFAVRFAVEDGRIVREAVVPATALDPCAASVVPGASGPTGGSLARRPVAPTAVRSSRPKAAAADPPPHRAQALGAQFANTSSGGADLAKTRVLVAVLIAIALLAAAAIPDQLVPDSRFGDALVRRRKELALGGAATLLATVIGYLASG
jgi:hypothetical protein